MRRFLVSYSYVTRRGAGFGSIYHERSDDRLPGPASLRNLRAEIAQEIGITHDVVVIIAVSEVSADGEVVV